MNSRFLSELKSLAKAGDKFNRARALTDAEIEQLERNANTCSDWSRVKIISEADAFKSSTIQAFPPPNLPLQNPLLENIDHNHFDGDILFSGFQGEIIGPDGRVWHAGVSRCRIKNSILRNCCLQDISRMENMVVEAGAIIMQVGDISCSEPTTFSFGLPLHPGTETGARTIWILDKATLEDFMETASLSLEKQKENESIIDTMITSYKSAYGFVGAGAKIFATPIIHSCYIGAGTIISGAGTLRNSIFLSPFDGGESTADTSFDSSSTISDGAQVESSLIHSNTTVQSSAKVFHSILLPKSSVALGGMVSHSVLGENTSVQKGEITASIVGPSVGFHHQSLLIAALWPEGRGNIGYGANVGSNHTGKKPDQEIRPGEGNFFGLGCSIKFPANFEDAPYSLFATGITTMPQRLRFPFSLINQPAQIISELSPGILEIFPGWTWAENAYSLVRRSYKNQDNIFLSRIFQNKIAALSLQALIDLKSATSSKSYFLDAHLSGLGKNFLTEKSRLKAIAAYQDYLCFYLMSQNLKSNLGLEEVLSNEAEPLIAKILSILTGTGAGAGVGVEARAGTRVGTAIAPHANMPTEKNSNLALQQFISQQKYRIEAFKGKIILSLKREMDRGQNIFDDYAEFHPLPEMDPLFNRLDQDLISLANAH